MSRPAPRLQVTSNLQVQRLKYNDEAHTPHTSVCYRLSQDYCYWLPLYSILVVAFPKMHHHLTTDWPTATPNGNYIGQDDTDSIISNIYVRWPSDRAGHCDRREKRRRSLITVGCGFRVGQGLQGVAPAAASVLTPAD